MTTKHDIFLIQNMYVDLKFTHMVLSIYPKLSMAANENHKLYLDIQ